MQQDASGKMQDQPASHALKDTWKREIREYQRILELHLELRHRIREKWHRALPFNDELFDRWERAAFLGFGQDASIYDSSLVLGDVQVGEHTWIGPFTVLDGSGGLHIGAWCSISAGVQIYTHDSVTWALTGGRAEYATSPTSIGDCCYLGPLTVVEKGVTIGHHSVIGANSLVNRNIPDHSIALGTPCRIVGQVQISEDSQIRFIWDNGPPLTL